MLLKKKTNRTQITGKINRVIEKERFTVILSDRLQYRPDGQPIETIFLFASRYGSLK